MRPRGRRVPARAARRATRRPRADAACRRRRWRARAGRLGLEQDETHVGPPTADCEPNSSDVEGPCPSGRGAPAMIATDSVDRLFQEAAAQGAQPLWTVMEGMVPRTPRPRPCRTSGHMQSCARCWNGPAVWLERRMPSARVLMLGQSGAGSAAHHRYPLCGAAADPAGRNRARSPARRLCTALHHRGRRRVHGRRRREADHGARAT